MIVWFYTTHNRLLPSVCEIYAPLCKIKQIQELYFFHRFNQFILLFSFSSIDRPVTIFVLCLFFFLFYENRFESALYRQSSLSTEVKIDCEQSLCSNIRGKENENIESVRYTSSGASLTLLVLLLIFLFVLTGFTYSKRETACELRSNFL